MNTSYVPLTNNSWKLVGQSSDDAGVREFVVSKFPYTIGRRPDVSLSISSPTISGRHAELVLEGDQLMVRDLGSTNGTFVNGARVTDGCVVNHGDLLQFAQIVFRANRQSATSYHATVQEDSADRAVLLIQFDKLLTDRAVIPHFQTVVELREQTSIGYEVLGRSRLFGLSDPQTMFMAAAVLKLESELSRILRSEGTRVGDGLPSEAALFLNTHPTEINDLELLDFSLREIRDLAPNRQIVLEIHEGTATRTSQMRELRAILSDLSIGMAYDDFGAGQARLVEIIEVPPDYLKFDMQLVQGISAASAERQRMVARLAAMTRELGIAALAEGVEELADHETCLQMGFTHAQGYLYGKPMPLASITGSTSGGSGDSAK